MVHKSLAVKTFLFKAARMLGVSTFRRDLQFDLLPYTQYGYGLYQAAWQAKQLGIPAISTIEFGVAGGNGLLELERYAKRIEGELGVQIRVYGFDTAQGLPEPDDFRDLPYVWKKGAFEMNREELERRKGSAELILGDVRHTTAEFFERSDVPPLGFIAFDLDYYSATKAVLDVIGGLENKKILPRVFAYFDDVVGGDEALHSEYTGELLAIKEFNGVREDRKLGQINGLRYKRVLPRQWNDQMYVLHIFTHAVYNKYLSKSDKQLPLIR